MSELTPALGSQLSTFFVAESEKVFFFKQKTAYEIRPCDWSSDVCSSDLRAAADFRIENRPQTRFDIRRPRHGGRGKQIEIGRASCRERVYGLVEISVV